MPAAGAVVTYDGGGDSGQFYEPVYTKADGTTVGERYIGHYMSPAEEEKKMEESGAITVLQTATRWVWKEGRGGYESVGDRKMLLITALMEFAGEFVHKDYRGWENNDGGQGNLTVDVKTRTASLEHTTYYTESTTDTTTMHAPARAPVRMPDLHNTEER